MSDDSYLNEVKRTRKRSSAAIQPTEVSATPHTDGPQPMVSLNVRISVEQSNALMAICNKKNWSKTQAIREAITLLEASND